VARFAALTGDRSSLHVSESFARRSAYRRPVAHGMLPLGFLATLSSFRVKGFHCAPTEVTGRFVSPVFAGDLLSLTATPKQGASNAGEVTFDYRIEHDGSGKLVTLGTITAAYTPQAGPVQNSNTTRVDGSMLLRPAGLSNFLIEQLDSGTKDTIDFQVTEETVADFIDLLALGIGDYGELQRAELREQFGIPTLLSVLFFSTSVGVSLPGESATFLEFSARSLRALEFGTVYRLQGTVTHRSMATRIIKKELVASRSGRDNDVVLHGKVTTLVNKPSQKMPTSQELGDAAADLGLKGKVALVTGASRGIGETTAKVLALAGAKVIVNYHRGVEDAGRIVQEITTAGGEAIAVAADVTNSDEVRALVRRGIDQYGAIDVLVNNAARDFRPIPFLQLTWEEIQKDLDVIAKGAFLCCWQVIPFMLEQGRGKIINISSVATDNPPLDQTKYVMAKSALVGLTRSLSIEFASRNIQVNLVVPNFVETDLVAHVAEGFRKKLAQDTPMRRHASAVDVARAVLYLASSLSSFTTGQKIMVTGGGAPYA
jgi:NAD(P)-dependent dehydrogenase (short-subunit alcohol dehydrogenase family)/acyl dehydratase